MGIDFDDLDIRTEPIMVIVMHYTVSDLKETFRLFSKNKKINGTLAHYLLDAGGNEYQFALDNKIAKHAGPSFWNGMKNLNQHSIGIENVNFGYSEVDLGEGVKVTGSEFFWYKFPDDQINQLEKLTHSLIFKYHIKPYNIVGHSDIAILSGRKEDPGIFFPWEKLAKKYGIGLWYNTNLKCNNRKDNEDTKKNIDKIDLFVKKLVQFGYGDPRYILDENDKPYGIKFTDDEEKINRSKSELIKNYNMHYRQDKGISYEVEDRDFEIIDSLLCLKLVTQRNDLSTNELVDLYNSVEQDYLTLHHFLGELPTY
jgi:N-acetyl-anhydromuramyl-L-alanine amidase AmpD